MKTALYVDCNSLWFGAFAYASKAIGRDAKPRVDYAALADRLTQHPGADAVPASLRAYVMAAPNVNVEGFKAVLESFGYDVHVWEKSVAKTARTAIMRDVTADAADFDHIVVATQDTFFAGLLGELRATGKRVSIACFNALPESYNTLGIGHIALDRDFLQDAPARAHV